MKYIILIITTAFIFICLFFGLNKKDKTLFDYIHDDLPLVMAAADLAICRSGASVIGELPATGLPAILVPYPYAGEHQFSNAQYLEENGAGIIIKNNDLQSQLLPTLKDLLLNQTQLDRMEKSSRKLACPSAAISIGNLIISKVEAS